MQNKEEILEPESTYHIYNRANGNEKLFLSGENYRYFLQKYQEYISPVADTFCYCLMPNHFHFLVRIKAETELVSYFSSKNLQGFENLGGLSALVSKQFGNLFNSYAKAFNKMYDRKGYLFMHTYKRKHVADEEYLRQLVKYIHQNPIEAKLTSTPEAWEFSSYKYLLSDQPSFLRKEEIIKWFEDTKNFVQVHAIKEPVQS